MVIKEYRGIRGLVAAELTVDTKNAITWGVPFEVAGTSELTRDTENSSEAHYYDNIPAIVIDTVGADTVTCSVSAIDLDVLSQLTGQDYDDETGLFIEGERTSKYFAIGYITEDTEGHEVFVWRLKVKCSIPSSTNATKNDGTDANGQEIVFTGINTQHKFTSTGKTAKAINLETYKDLTTLTETTFFTTVQTPDSVAAAKRS